MLLQYKVHSASKINNLILYDPGPISEIKYKNLHTDILMHAQYTQMNKIAI